MTTTMGEIFVEPFSGFANWLVNDVAARKLRVADTDDDDKPITMRDIRRGATIAAWIGAIITGTLVAVATALSILQSLRELAQ